MVIWPLSLFSQDSSGSVEPYPFAPAEGSVLVSMSSSDVGSVLTNDLRLTPHEFSFNLGANKVNLGLNLSTRDKSDINFFSIGPIIRLAFPSNYFLELTPLISAYDVESYTEYNGLPRGGTAASGRILLERLKHWMVWNLELTAGHLGFSRVPFSPESTIGGDGMTYQIVAQFEKLGEGKRPPLDKSFAIRSIAGRDLLTFYSGMGIGLNLYYKYDQPLLSFNADFVAGTGGYRGSVGMSGNFLALYVW